MSSRPFLGPGLEASRGRVPQELARVAARGWTGCWEGTRDRAASSTRRWLATVRWRRWWASASTQRKRPQRPVSVCCLYTVRTAEGLDGTAPLVRCTVTANGYAATDSMAESLGAAVRAALAGFDGSSSGVRVRQLTLADGSKLHDTDVALWGRLATFTGWIVQ